MYFCVFFVFCICICIGTLLFCKVASLLCFFCVLYLCFVLGHCCIDLQGGIFSVFFVFCIGSQQCIFFLCYHTSSYIFWVLFIICLSVFHSRSTKRWTRNRVWTPSSGFGQAATLPPPSVMSVLIQTYQYKHILMYIDTMCL